MTPKRGSRPDLPPGWRAYESGEIRKPIPLRAPGDAPRLLVVDDDAGIRRSLERLLGVTYRVTIAEPQQALELIRAGETFDVILSDLRMPVMDGVELFGAIEAAAPDLARRIIFMTGGADRAALTFLAERGLPVLGKPFEPELLHALVRAVLDREAAR
ncbi:MAG: response regulator [Polyangiaceae bacterium]